MRKPRSFDIRNPPDRLLLDREEDIRVPAYVIATTSLASPQKDQECRWPAGIATAKNDGSFCAGSGESAVLNGMLAANRDVIVEYPDLVTPSRFCAPQDHRATLAVRENAAAFTLVVVSG